MMESTKVYFLITPYHYSFDFNLAKYYVEQCQRVDEPIVTSFGLLDYTVGLDYFR